MDHVISGRGISKVLVAIYSYSAHVLLTPNVPWAISWIVNQNDYYFVHIQYWVIIGTQKLLEDTAGTNTIKVRKCESVHVQYCYSYIVTVIIIMT